MKGECHQPADSTKAESAVLLLCLKLLEFIDKISRWVLIVNMLLMTLLVVFQVLTRYLFFLNSVFKWGYVLQVSYYGY